MLAFIFDLMSFSMTAPTSYGWFHILWLLLTVGVTVLLCLLYKHGKIKNPIDVVFYTAMIVIVLEIYKQIYYSFSYDGSVQFDFQWFAFPWQFCSMPMYVGLLVGLTRGKLQGALLDFLATFALFAGASVMIYPEQVFTVSVWINIQSMICHASMIVVGVFLYYTGTVKARHKTILGGMMVFSAAVGMAVLL
ncbi:MAG: YwaF family protein, partial [Clostridia bacterium]|nr:YwaF family protein [Clostridia bacterium]